MKSWDSLRSALETQEWPGTYTFKFIAPLESVTEVLNAYPDQHFIHKPSSKGNYISLTFTRVMASPEEIISWYQRVAHVKGLISL